MFIKQIIIQGFKSYKDQTVVDPFSPKHNVIVGRNGSGKSNFFAAIRFVLGDHYNQMGREERQALLHEGSGSAVMSAYVEIIFDNQDERFPTNTPEVTLRRSIGLKKDEYSLNRKNTTKLEVLNLLESAGFSKSNPYYIVPQGRITHITNMKDSERLNMLKEVAGTQIYEQRRAESIKMMDDATNQRTKIEDVLDHIRGKLDELEEEKNELREYQEKDRERRCLEYTIYHREQEALQEALDKLEEDREDGVGQSDESQARLAEAERQLEEVESKILDLQQNLVLLNEEKKQFEQDRDDTLKEKAALEYDVQALAENSNAAQQSRQQLASDLQTIRRRIKERESELAKLLPTYQQRQADAQALQQQIQQSQSTRQILLAKQGRSAGYRNKRERDDDLKQQIADVNTQVADRQAIAVQTENEIQALNEQVNQLEGSITTMRARLENRGGEQESISTKTQAFKEEKEKLSDRRKEIWREEAKIDSLLTNARQEMDKSERFLSQMMDQNTSRGIASVRRIVQQQGIEGVYGTLGELFDFSDKFKTAVEITAGTSLFHFVVDTDATATRIVDVLQKEKAGRVTFMPLNRLHPRPMELPSAADAIPLLSKLKYDPMFEKAYQQVFGKTIVCPDLRAASHYARSHGVSAITPEGDRSNKKGALTGGYHDTRNSRIDGLKRVRSAREELDSLLSRQQKLREERETLDQQITKAVSEIQKIEHQRMQAENGYGPLRQEVTRREQEIFSKRDEAERKQRAKNNIDTLVNQLRQQLSGYQHELSSPFTKALTDEEEQQLRTASETLPALRQQFGQIDAESRDAESKKNEIEIELRENLRLRLDQLSSQDTDGDNSDAGAELRLNERKKDLDRLTKKLDTWNTRLKQHRKVIEDVQRQQQSADASRTEQQQLVEDMTRAISHTSKILQKSAQKKRTVQNRLDEVAASIRALGVLPDAAFNKPYTTMQNQTATVRLHKAQEALKKFGHVNKKAFEQYSQFENQRDALETRHSELLSGANSIEELIQQLDTQKDEAIERTFRQVSREFATAFEKLVPAGKGRLIIQRRVDQSQEADDASDDEAQRSSVENYTGVGISVSFNSKHDEQQRIQQLSGGQKSLCALTLIFAIQASDPAPFYLFDEIDANLDAQYRTAVADLIKESASSGQFICTTFRPEMLRVADKCYGVSQTARASRIKPVETNEALEFVEGQIAAT
ncbi:hypothetical protein MRB53_040277 [Persea americana]|nr:hypothetical protein MRB53_040277 [Persea americana]